MRWLFFIVLAALAWLLWKGLIRVKKTSGDETGAPRASDEQQAAPDDTGSKPGARPRPDEASPPASGHQQQDLPVQNMVSCAYCGAWSPESLAFKQQNQWFCDENHAKAKS
ncbi:MAG: hypothetical protein EBT36_04810 [Betaproteobacteria bacterium]|jgi:hypothetical protein|nr:hypothetical protein [Pseudomonadota bacterium]NBO04086.1 hypothetical protein [Betaproteobacteria bacterium]NBO96286.1 hypothetical protein [Betaproteobacteria bacterium]NBP34828.1 hypothetical protein [Betaproteobacteria bacterium]NBP38202.1 hypothetical protein [Betaproteobacteria bacterium]